MQTMKLTLTVAAIASVAALATAQPWANNYAAGEDPVFNPAWTPNAPAYLMTNLGGNVYGIDITPAGVGPGVYNRFQWKVTDGTWSNSAPANSDENAYGRATTTATVVSLRCDFNAQNDGFIPDVGVNGQNGILYTIPKVWDGAAKVILVGDFNGWSNNDLTYELKDDGVAPDQTANDGIYTGQFTFSAGTHQFLVLPVFGSDPGSWDLKLSQRGISAGGNLQVAVTGSDPYTFTVDTNKGRIKIESTAPPITYPTALSSAWSTVPGPDTQLFDDGTNGDAVAGDGIYSRLFTISNASAGGIDKVNVLHNGNTYPATGGYPFTSANGLQVLVSYDTNTYSDGYLPATKFVWVNASRRLLPGSPNGPVSVNVTGDFVSLLGGSDWNPGDPLTQLADNGTNGDAVAGDKIYTIVFPGSIVPAMSGKNWKATGGSWDWQYGSPDNGFTLNGNNPNMTLNTVAGQDLVFKVDAITGRAGYGQPTLVDPTRPAQLNNNSGVADWQLF
jgi:hypothetical protein